jgi:hypothetical protein
MAAKKSTPELETEIARLYSLPLAEFTAERNALAARLRKEGDRDASERVKGLAKPSVSAWAVNVLFRDQKETMDAFLAAGRRARGILQEALSKGTGAESLPDAMQDERDLRDDLRRRAVALLSPDGKEPGRDIVDRITNDLEALALSPAAEAAAERGWLDRDLDPPGFEIFAGLPLAPRRERHGMHIVPSPPAPAREKEKEERKGKEEEREDREEKAERERREKETAKARERIARAEEKVARAAEEEATLRSEAERAEKAAVKAEAAAAEARRRAEADREAADRAKARADRAAEALARAEADLAALR